MPGQPRMRTNAADMRRAKQALMRLSDLRRGSFRIDGKGWGAPQIPHCPSGYPGDRSGVTITGEASSSFTDGFDLMGSTALLFKTYADAGRYWKQTARPAFATCDAAAIRAHIIKGAKAKTLLARELPISRTGADAAAVYRTITRIFVPGHPAYDWYQTTLFVKVARGVAIARIAYANQPCDCHPEAARTLTRRLRTVQQG
jgi:hypothetical protein